MEIKNDIREEAKHLAEEHHELRKKERSYFSALFNIRDDMMSYAEIDEMMHENTVIYGPNMWILMLAILIASIGLNVNSTAVIIGAMLISPLMSGIMTMGYSLAVRDLSLLKKALIRFLTQVVISLTASTLYFTITPLSEPTSEMIARTSPTLWDVMIAVFGGIAGMIGNTRRKKGNVIPGVAIATALMPPLCTAGYGIATGRIKFFAGAFYLFLINTIFIALSTAFVTLILKVPYHRHIKPAKQKYINFAVAIIATVMIIPSVFIGASTVYDSVMTSSVSRYLTNEFVFPNTQLVKSDVDRTNSIISVSLVGDTISDDTIAALEHNLGLYGLGTFSLRVTQNMAYIGLEADDEASADKITIYMHEHTISELQAQLDEQQAEMDSLNAIIDGYKAEEAARPDMAELASEVGEVFDRLVNCRCGIMEAPHGKTVVLMAEVRGTLSEDTKAVIRRLLISETGADEAELILSPYIPRQPEPAAVEAVTTLSTDVMPDGEKPAVTEATEAIVP